MDKVILKSAIYGESNLVYFLWMMDDILWFSQTKMYILGYEYFYFETKTRDI